MSMTVPSGLTGAGKRERSNSSVQSDSGAMDTNRHTMAETGPTPTADASDQVPDIGSAPAPMVTDSRVPPPVAPALASTVPGSPGVRRYVAMQLVGRGGFGVVYRCRDSYSGDEVAVKRVRENERSRNREAEILSQLRHPNIVQLLDFFRERVMTVPSTAGSSSGSNSCGASGVAGPGLAAAAAAAAVPAAAAAAATTRAVPAGMPSTGAPDVRVTSPSSASTSPAMETHLCLVMEFVPDTLASVLASYNRTHSRLPILLVKVYAFQILRALAYLHQQNICHRDLKPHNILVRRPTAVVKLCDFGSAKRLVLGEGNTTYISSRHYRAPELMFNWTQYTCAIDLWSFGVVLAEMLSGMAPFQGGPGVEQVIAIMKVLGTPTPEEIHEMNPSYASCRLPPFPKHDIADLLPADTPPDALDLLRRLLCYSPSRRLTALQALAHPFFDELREVDRVPPLRLPNGNPLPPLFAWSRDEWHALSQSGLTAAVLPLRRGPPSLPCVPESLPRLAPRPADLSVSQPPPPPQSLSPATPVPSLSEPMSEPATQPIGSDGDGAGESSVGRSGHRC